MSLKGMGALQARLDALRGVFLPIADAWSNETVKLARSRVAVRTGRTRGSIHKRSVTKDHAIVSAAFGARYLEAGTREHDITPRNKRVLRFQGEGRTIFSKKVHKLRTSAQPFLRPSGRQALADVGPEVIVETWNRAA